MGLILITATTEQKLLAEKWDEYQQDPQGFITNCLDVKPEHYWHKMQVIANSVRDNQFTAVPACHDVSKTYLAGRLATWFKSVFNPSTVVTTAPSDKLVKEQLWREIHTSYSGAKVNLGGKMTTLQWDCKPSQKILEELEPDQRKLWEKNFAIGFSTSPDTATENATKMQGYHNKWVLVILDEAGGILRAIWKAALEGLIINERCKILAIGNPTDPTGYFYKVCQPGSGWNVINISVTDTPNYKENREIIPNVAGRNYYNRMKRDHGEESNTFKIRVLGQFPEWLEGTYHGSRLAKAIKDKRVGDYPCDEDVPVYTFNDLGDVYTATLFVQFLRGMIRIISDYWDYEGKGLPAWSRVLDSKGWTYRGNFAGPDLDTSNAKNFQTGKTTIDMAAEYGKSLTPVIAHRFDDGIRAAHGIWPLIQINKKTCKTFIEAMAGYGKKKNIAASTDEQTVYYDQVAKTWHRHFGDALRHLAMAYRYMEIGGEYIGDISKISAYHSGEGEQKQYDPMDFI